MRTDRFGGRWIQDCAKGKYLLKSIQITTFRLGVLFVGCKFISVSTNVHEFREIISPTLTAEEGGIIVI